MTSHANEARGEVDIVLGKKRRVLRPSYEAIIAIEKLTGHSLRDLTVMANAVRMPLETMSIVVAELIRAGAAADDVGARHGQADGWGKLIYRVGIPSVSARLLIVLTAALTGGATAEGELMPVAENGQIDTAIGD
ncbi:hypothetical protein SAMN06295912_108117 [Sphingomonas laterariae]|uniref:Uncharacterized protein n=1 Tax=Edaphosphingomonas laterariae TaxID=861865 RepID=A0A239F9K5_9SPHN|nr:hypothetical protein [Sphingomonas laterariae]SNS53178.1 hypothetical protein SAMN06295912_108117 [Sphingomonas laterariae]